MNEYMDHKQWSQRTKNETNQYLDFLRKRARGEVPTGAHFIRDFVLNHPEYKQDSIVSPKIAFDLVEMIDSLESVNEDREALRIKLLGKAYL